MAAFDSLQKLRVDFIKITDNTLKPELYLKAVAIARKKGWPVTGHIPASLPLEQVSDAGLSAVEHFSYLRKAGAMPDGFDTAQALAVYRRLAANGTAVVPTLNISRTIAYLDSNDHANDDYLRYIGKGLKRTYDWRVQRAAKDDAAAVAKRHRDFEAAASLLPLVKASGIKIIAGTDAGYLNSFDYPGIGLHDELALYVKYGLSPLEAIQASVLNGPAFFHLGNYGSLEKGKAADIVFLRNNPLENIEATRSVQAVMRGGRYLDRKALDALLAAIAKKVAEGY
ncbi:MAG: amidohydrolase family protein [Flavihumibacter sp.]